MDYKERGISEQISDAAKGISKLNIRKETSSFGESTRQEDKIKYNKLITDAKEKGRQGHAEEALVLFKKALALHSNEKLLKRIQKLEAAIREMQMNEEEEEDDEEDEEDNDGMVDVGNGFRLAKEIYDALYPYQKEAILWLWGLFKQTKGGILGDDMGLGKTIQIIAFLSGMFDNEHIKSALIVMPVSLITNWEKEFRKWAPGIRVRAFHGSSKKERQKHLESVQRKGGVCVTTYGMVVSNVDLLSTNQYGRQFTWDYIILDEGHKIKNTTKTSKNIRAIPAKNHFILSGTPVQNNLKEMWALFDFVTEGQLLGTSRTFKKEFGDPIVRARERDASAYEKRIGAKMSESLRELIAPHFLRRTKAMVLGNKKKQDSPDGEQQAASSASVERVPEELTRKNDFIVWLFLSDTQLKIYKDFISLESVKEILMSKRSPLAELNVLKKVCDHPRLLSEKALQMLGLDEESRTLNMDDDKENVSFSANQMQGSGPSDKVLIQESGKLVFLVALMDNLRSEGHRCLIFSQSTKMLDIIQKVLSNRGHKMLRIDGNISSTAEREHLITTFQKNPSYTCFLLTTQVGGVGITLTAADRVVIFDPSWNPATDAQAVDRVYRIGQKRSVIIYRLITCATLEEKIYRKQIFKDALMKQTTGTSKNPFRYFSREELQDMFTLDAPDRSRTQEQLMAMHSKHRKTDERLDKHVTFLQSLNIFGLSDHDLMYSQEAVEAPEEMADNTYNDVIHAKVQRAQDLVAKESGARGVHHLPPEAPATCPRPPKKTPLDPGEAGLPRHSLPNSGLPLSAKEKIQTKMNQFEVFKPSREDTKRFVPRNVPRTSPEQSHVVDLCTPPKSQPSSVSEVFIDLTETEHSNNQKLSTLTLREDQASTSEAVEEPTRSTWLDEQQGDTLWDKPESVVQDDSPDVEKMAALREEECARQTPKRRRSLNPKKRRSMSQRLMVPELDDSDDDDEVTKPDAVTSFNGDEVFSGSSETDTSEELAAPNRDHSVAQSSVESINDEEQALEALERNRRFSTPVKRGSPGLVSEEDVSLSEEAGSAEMAESSDHSNDVTESAGSKDLEDIDNDQATTPLHVSSGHSIDLTRTAGSEDIEDFDNDQATTPLHVSSDHSIDLTGTAGSEDIEDFDNDQATTPLHVSSDHSIDLTGTAGSKDMEDIDNDQATTPPHMPSDHSIDLTGTAGSEDMEDFDNDQATTPMHVNSIDVTESAGSSDKNELLPMPFTHELSPLVRRDENSQLGNTVSDENKVQVTSSRLLDYSASEESFSGGEDESSQSGSTDLLDENEAQMDSSAVLNHSAEESFSGGEDENSQSGSAGSSGENEVQIDPSPVLDHSAEESFSGGEDENSQSGGTDSSGGDEVQMNPSPVLDHAAMESFSGGKDENSQSGSTDSSGESEAQMNPSAVLDHSAESFSGGEDESNQPEPDGSKHGENSNGDTDDDAYLSANSDDNDDDDFQSFTTPVSPDEEHMTVVRTRPRVRVRRIDSDSEDDGSGFESVEVSPVLIDDPECGAGDGECNSGCPTGVHTSRVLQNIQRCPCVIDDDDKSRYDALLIQARNQKSEGMNVAALKTYLQALQIMDSDLQVHRQVLMLKSKAHKK